MVLQCKVGCPYRHDPIVAKAKVIVLDTVFPGQSDGNSWTLFCTLMPRHNQQCVSHMPDQRSMSGLNCHSVSGAETAACLTFNELHFTCDEHCRGTSSIPERVSAFPPGVVRNDEKRPDKG